MDINTARSLVHNPAELTAEYVSWAESIQAHPGIPFGIRSIDKVVLPMRPGNLVCILARPGHGKSTLLAWIARAEAQRILARGTSDREAVVYVTWEQTSEELSNVLFSAGSPYSATDVAWGKVDLDVIKKRAIKQVHQPVWILGHGIGRVGTDSVPRMTPELVLGAIESMYVDYGVRPVLLLFDYLQLIPVEQARDRIQQVTEIPFRIKEIALRIGAPAVAAVQARQEVDDRNVKLPTMRDAQWASSITQTADKAYAAWIPSRSEPLNSMVRIGDQSFQVTENLLVLRMLKQRFEKGFYTWALHFDPAFLKLAELETRTLDAYE